MTDVHTHRNADGSLATHAHHHEGGSRVGWGAVFAGLAIAVALQVTLSVLGAAIGLTALDGRDDPKSFGIGAGIWALLVPLVTMFMGGRVAGSLAHAHQKRDAFVHGALVWALAVLLATWLLGTGASRLIGGALGAVSDVATDVAGGAAANPDAAARTAERAQGAAQDAAQDQGVSADSARRVVEQAQQRAGQVADRAQGIAASGAWLALLGLGLSLAASVFGARSGARTDHHADHAAHART